MTKQGYDSTCSKYFCVMGDRTRWGFFAHAYVSVWGSIVQNRLVGSVYLSPLLGFSCPNCTSHLCGGGGRVTGSLGVSTWVVKVRALGIGSFWSRTRTLMVKEHVIFMFGWRPHHTGVVLRCNVIHVVTDMTRRGQHEGGITTPWEDAAAAGLCHDETLSVLNSFHTQTFAFVAQQSPPV